MGLRRKIPVSVEWLSLTETETAGKRFSYNDRGGYVDSCWKVPDKASEMSV